MHRKQGFTLVELLVVMAIIAILASIVVPNVTQYIRQSRMTQAMSEIHSMELAFTKMLADSNRNSLHQLFDPNKVQEQIRIMSGDALPPGKMQNWTFTNFEEAKSLYSNAFYALLRLGRGAAQDSVDIYNHSVLQKLGTSYLEIGLDPWGQRYEVFPGPWKASAGAVPFRIFKVSQEELSLPGAFRYRDGWQYDSYFDSELDKEIEGDVGFAAPYDLIAFIYSKGEYQISGQMLFDGTVLLRNNPLGDNPADMYDSGQEEDYAFGGDDVNNWDKGQSYKRFYN